MFIKSEEAQETARYPSLAAGGVPFPVLLAVFFGSARD